MSHLDSSVIVIAVQITVPLLAALLLSLRRNAAASCFPLVWGAAAVLLLTACAFLPFSFWPPSQAAPAVSTGAALDPASVSPVEEPSPAPLPDRSAASGGIDLFRLLPLLNAATTQTKTESNKFRSWPACIAIGLAALGLLRFGFELFAVGMARHRSRPLSAPELLTVLEGLRAELDCRRPIDIRECGRIGSAATIGWRRPVILLASDWRTWTADELRAVLAHEVAHVTRRDFVGRLVARLAVAIHCYHPLALWLVRRLELRQEMAADTVAARYVGGRDVYLRCLASLALRTDSRSVGMMPTFLSRPRTLLRRIAMLGAKEDSQTVSHGWWGVGIIGALSLLTLGFHGSSPEVLAEPPAPAKILVAARPPLDVSLVQWGQPDKDTVGYYALRVDEMLKLPGIEKLGKEYTAMLEQLFGFKQPLRFQDIEQVAGRVSLKVNKGQPSPNHSFMLSLSMIRFNRDIDWSTGLEKIFGKATPRKHGDETYYEVELTKKLQGLLGPQKTMHLYPSDSRTLVLLESEDVVKQAIDGKKKDKPKASWNDQWHQVEGGMLALVFTDTRKLMKGKLAVDPAEKEISVEERIARKAMESIFSKTDSMVLGVDVRADLSFKAYFKSGTPADAKAIVSQCGTIHKLLKTAANEQSHPKDSPAPVLAASQIENELLANAAIRPIEGGVVISAESTNGLKALWKALAEMTEE